VVVGEAVGERVVVGVTVGDGEAGTVGVTVGDGDGEGEDDGSALLPQLISTDQLSMAPTRM
jgi:hypothetical protein